jgi:hypothetical protein
MVEVIRSRNTGKITFQKTGLTLTILIGSLTLFFGEDVIENLDWRLRRSSRDEIVNLVKEDKLRPNVAHNNIICTLDNWNIPPISNGGNEIAIYKTNDNKVTVEFFINRGFLDHYSAFVFTEDPEKIQELEERTTTKKKGLHVNKKLSESWYRVSY